MSHSALSQGTDQSTNSSNRQLHLSLHHVTIFVRDQDRSLRFYVDQLGFNLAIDARLESGDRWVAVAGDEYGEQRLIEALRRNRDLSSEALLASIVEDVQHFSPHEQHDDITLIVARCREDQ
jgi:catechol 2,3-dioxygenase-like lactoylglutathione lyase family enzyme